MNAMDDSDSQQFTFTYLHQVGLLLKPINIGCIFTVPMKYGLLWNMSIIHTAYYCWAQGPLACYLFKTLNYPHTETHQV